MAMLKFCMHDEIVLLKSLQISVRDYIIFKKKGNSSTLKHPNQKVSLFKDFKALKNYLISI